MTTKTAELRAQLTAGIAEQRKSRLDPPIYAQRQKVDIPRMPRSPGKQSAEETDFEMRRRHEHETWTINYTASEISGGIGRLKSEMEMLRLEVRADQDGKRDFEVQLEFLQKRKRELEKRIADNEAWIAYFDRDIAPFKDKYERNVQDAERAAEEARRISKKAMSDLQKRLRSVTK